MWLGVWGLVSLVLVVIMLMLSSVCSLVVLLRRGGEIALVSGIRSMVGVAVAPFVGGRMVVASTARDFLIGARGRGERCRGLNLVTRRFEPHFVESK